MKLQNTAILLVCTMLAAILTGCSNEGQSTGSDIESVTEAVQESTQKITQGKLHITIESVKIPVSDLKAQDYTVPVYVRLDKNPGISYSEWGVRVDRLCTFTVDKKAKNLDFAVYHAINEEENFLWTAWASGTELITDTGNLICMNVTLPRTAKAGDSFSLDYADWSLADAPHIWTDTSNKDWAESDDVTWTDGVITVTQ